MADAIYLFIRPDLTWYILESKAEEETEMRRKETEKQVKEIWKVEDE